MFLVLCFTSDGVLTLDELSKIAHTHIVLPPRVPNKTVRVLCWDNFIYSNVLDFVIVFTFVVFDMC